MQHFVLLRFLALALSSSFYLPCSKCVERETSLLSSLLKRGATFLDVIVSVTHQTGYTSHTILMHGTFCLV